MLLSPLFLANSNPFRNTERCPNFWYTEYAKNRSTCLVIGNPIPPDSNPYLSLKFDTLIL